MRTKPSSIGIGFSIPSNTAKRVIDQLVAFGETRRGWLGVKIQEVTDDLAKSLKLDLAHGAPDELVDVGAELVELFVGLGEAPSLPHASSLCGACTEACPVKIPLHELLLDLRRRSRTAPSEPTDEREEATR